ncbi:hypothetical protein JTE88_03665 [Arcanobacterium phocisimile]|uniref:Uncharacterized protein n=1 Tax=Arcanobacterium phocisimile TaxID=1302235 RepID=A0ABX7IJ23_9ACTO|nr:hypothetical protein [Arcanobacterium phocisimile]QRV02832.1 hypothetical protein JTE88_03665 [Arcanobacterium phocisimile]
MTFSPASAVIVSQSGSSARHTTMNFGKASFLHEASWARNDAPSKRAPIDIELVAIILETQAENQGVYRAGKT